MVKQIRQSPPLDLSKPTNDTWIKGKTIIITGGASGFGAGFFEKWAELGACVIIGDINIGKAEQLVRDVKKRTGNSNLHFCHCDVTDWQSQVQFFKTAIRVSPHKGIDAVVANAGVVDSQDLFERPTGLDQAEPPPPNLNLLDVNLTGVLYTAHLALFHLPRNPGSVAATPDSDPSTLKRDRHLILMASMAGLGPIPSQPIYGVSKHAVVGLYRNLRASCFLHGIRTNLICPYFVDTPLLTAQGRFFLAGCPVGKPEDVVEAATRLAADPRIVGRAMAVGPKVKVRDDAEGHWEHAEGRKEDGNETAIFEVYAHDFEDTELFTRRIIGLYNRITEVRGWIGWVGDVIAAMRYSLRF